MNKIQKFALANHPMNTDCLAAVLDALEKKGQINLNHILEVILGMKEEEMSTEMPEKAALPQQGGKVCRFKSYDILTDTVCYEYDDVIQRWFRNEEDVEKFLNSEYFYNLDYKYSESEDYPCLGEKPTVSKGYCSFEEWNYSI